MTNFHFKNIVGFNLFLVVFSVVYLISAMSLGKPVENARLTPSAFPIFLGACAMVISLILFYKGLTNENEATEKDTSANRFLPVIITIATLLYILLFQKLGYLITTIAYVYALVILYSDYKRLLSKLVYSAIITALGYLIFVQIFNVRLPTLMG